MDFQIDFKFHFILYRNDDHVITSYTVLIKIYVSYNTYNVYIKFVLW